MWKCRVCFTIKWFQSIFEKLENCCTLWFPSFPKNGRFSFSIAFSVSVESSFMVRLRTLLFRKITALTPSFIANFLCKFPTKQSFLCMSNAKWTQTKSKTHSRTVIVIVNDGNHMENLPFSMLILTNWLISCYTISADS